MQKFLLGTAVALAMAPSFVSAETEQQLDQIIVSASRTPLTINQTGSTVSVIDREDIERREARNVAELLRSVPGFAVSHTGVVGSQTQARIRGAEANHILVLIDGVRANDPATGDEFRWETLSTGNIERIEIVRGPQSSLWGSDAVAAVVHIISRGGGDQRFDGFVETGSFGTTNGALNAAIGDEDWSLTASIEHHDTDGQNISRTGNEKDNADITTASVASRVGIAENVVWSSGLRLVDAYSQFDPVDFFVTGLPTDGDSAADASNIYAHTALDIVAGRLSHNLAVRYFESDNDDLVDGTATSGTESDRLTIGYQLGFALGENRASVAVEHEATEFRQQGAASPFGDPNYAADIDVSSLILEYQGLAHRLNWILSGRFDSNSDFDDAFNGRLALSYPLSDQSVLRGSVSTGRKNPTFIERFGFFPDQFIGNPALQPERSVSWELGVRQDIVDGAATLDVAVFHQDLDDEINGFVFDPVTFLFTADNQDGSSKRTGVETSVRWPISDQFSFSAHYTYTDSSEPDGSGGENRELRRPRHSAGLGARFATADQRVTASLNADFGGERIDRFFPPFPAAPQIVTLDDYWLVDVAAQYRATDAVVVYVKGSNLLDEDYEQVFGYRTLGRAGYFGIRVSFGE